MLSQTGNDNSIKNFPLQNAEGVITLDTGDELLDVLKYTLGQVESASHIKPIIYTGRELSFITREVVPEIDDYRKSLIGIIGNSNIQVLLHDSVFVKIGEASPIHRFLFNSIVNTDHPIKKAGFVS